MTNNSLLSNCDSQLGQPPPIYWVIASFVCIIAAIIFNALYLVIYLKFTPTATQLGGGCLIGIFISSAIRALAFLLQLIGLPYDVPGEVYYCIVNMIVYMVSTVYRDVLLSCLAYDRFLYVEHPLNYATYLFQKKPSFLIVPLFAVFALAFSTVLSSTDCFCIQSYRVCLLVNDITLLRIKLNIVIYALVELVAMAMFGYYHYRIWKSVKRLTNSLQLCGESHSSSVRTFAAIGIVHGLMVIAPTCLFSVCNFVFPFKLRMQLVRTAVLVATLSDFVVPTLYVFLDRQYKDAVMKFVKGPH